MNRDTVAVLAAGFANAGVLAILLFGNPASVTESYAVCLAAVCSGILAAEHYRVGSKWWMVFASAWLFSALVWALR